MSELSNYQLLMTVAENTKKQKANDRELRYTKLVQEIYENIESLEKIGFDTSTIRDEVSSLERKIAIEKEKPVFDYKSYSSIITEFEKINSQLTDSWETLFEVEKTISSLQNSLKIDNQTENPYSLVLEVLNKIKQTPQMDASEGKKLADLVYPVIYNYIKLESVCQNESNLLKVVKNDPVHKNYIIDLMNKDIKRLPDDKKNQILLAEYEIEKNGFDTSLLLNRELFQMIANASSDFFVEDQRKIIRRLYKEYMNDKTQIDNTTFTVSNNLSTYKSDRNYFLIDLAKLIFRITIFGAVMIPIGVASISCFKDEVKDRRTYSIVTTTYDLESNQKTTTEEYENTNNVVFVQKVMPWEKGSEFDDFYRRDIYIYEMNYEEGLDPKDYVEKRECTNFTSEIETSETKPSDYETYSEPKYRVVTKEQGEDYKQGIILDIIIAYLIVDLLALVCVFALNRLITQNNIAENVDDLKRYAKKIVPSRTRLKESTAELKALIKECNELLEQLKKDPRLSLIADEVANLEEEQKIKMKL